MSNEDQISDRAAREAAETTFDRNVVVVAGAGTGKTTLLVNRIIHLLMKEPRPIGITELVALTFTNKAATEMKVRLRDRLMVLTQSAVGIGRSGDGGAVSAHDLQTRYGMTMDRIAERAGAALQDLEKAQIGTLHSFAAHLLRLHPLESRVDPAFQEDDGSRFDEHFTTAWDLWINQELSRQGGHHDLWRSILASATVEQVRDLVRSLCSELVDIEVLQQQLGAAHLAPTIVDWLTKLRSRTQILLRTHDRPKRRKIEQMLAAALSYLALVIERQTLTIPNADPSIREWLGKDVGAPVAGWDKSEFSEARSLIETVQQFHGLDRYFFVNLLRLYAPLIRSIRNSFVEKGWLSFDGLLARARQLLWDHRAVRARIKQDYRAILVDEFQDTDPVQYDIILAVSEWQGAHAMIWQEMKLEPGKLFIVGDPKQSIYAFRRADIEAFDRVVQKIEADHGIVHTLTTNFRSDAAVLGPMNDIFDRLLIRRPLVQPANVRLEVRPQRRPATLAPGIHLQLTRPGDGDETFDSAEAARAESEVLARWLKEDFLARPHASAGQVALLFRKLTQADVYLDALRRYGIAYVIEGEKHFYRRQEVIDFINLLRVLDHPHDQVALAGLLRSPLGGMTDRDLYDLHQAGLWDYLQTKRIESWSHPRAAAVRRLYGHLVWLHCQVVVLPLAEAIQLTLDRLPILELAAASLHSEQAVMNLLKVKQTAASLSDRAHLTMSGFVDLMVARLDEQPDEAESPLAEESSDAVQVLTIHKAKGLEFPVVVLPGLHQGTGPMRSVPNVLFDWSSGTYGLSLGEHRTLGALLIQDKLAAREAAERRRVLYVGMTRAKEVLLLSGSATARAVGETVFDLLQEIGDGTVGDADMAALKIGASAIPHRVVQAPDRKRPRRSLTVAAGTIPVDSSSVARLWSERRERWTQARETDWHVTPTAMNQPAGLVDRRAGEAAQDRAIGRLVGVLAHRILERWDFSGTAHQLLDQIASAVRNGVLQEQEPLIPVVTDSLRELFTTFGKSDVYARLRSATILGREVPFIMPWGNGQVMEGVIDLIYRLDGTIWIADYKTDQVTAAEAPTRATTYAQQGWIYREAVSRCLGLSPVSFQFMFLRPGVTVELS